MPAPDQARHGWKFLTLWILSLPFTLSYFSLFLSLSQYFYYSVSKNPQLPSCTTVHKDAQIQNGCDLPENVQLSKKQLLLCSWRHMEVQMCLRAREGQKGHQKKEYCDKGGLGLCLRVQTQTHWRM